MSVHVGVRSVGLRGWHTVWQGMVVTKHLDGTISAEKTGPETLDPVEARAEAEKAVALLEPSALPEAA